LAALKANPKNSEAAFKAANILWRQQKYDEAADLYRKELEGRPNHAEGWLGLGLCLKEAGKKEEARAAFQKACQGGIRQACAHYKKLGEP